MLSDPRFQRINTAYQKLNDIGFSEQQAYTLLALLEEEAEKESSLTENIMPAFNRKLKDINSGKLTRSKLQNMLGENAPSPLRDTDAQISMHILSRYYNDDESDDLKPKEILKHYLKCKNVFFLWLKDDLKAGRTVIDNITFIGTDLTDIVTGLLNDLNEAGMAGIREAIILGDFLYKNFRFDRSGEYSDYMNTKFLMHYADSLNAVQRYKDCDNVLVRLKKEACERIYYVEEKVRTLRNRDHNAMIRADQIASAALDDPDFINSEEIHGALYEFEQVFKALNDEYNLERVEKAEDQVLSRNLNYDNDDEIDDQRFYAILSMVAESIDELVKQDEPNAVKASQYLSSLGYDQHEIRTILAAVLMTAALSDEEPDINNGMILETLNEVPLLSKDTIDQLLEQFDYSLIRHLNSMMLLFNETEDYERGAELLLENEDGIINFIEMIQDEEKTDEYQVFQNALEAEQNVNFRNFIVAAAASLAHADRQEDLMRMSRKLLSMFDFSKDDSDVYAVLKESAAESMDKVGYHNEADVYIKQWKKRDPDGTDPLWAEMWICHNRKDIKRGVEIADQIMKMPLDEVNDIQTLLKTVEIIYTDAGDKKKLKAVHRLMDEYGLDND